MTHPQPLGGNEMPRFAGITTFMRLPGTSDLKDLDAAIIGVPLDIGTTNRSGSRFGPRAIRAESVLIRPYAMWTAAAPFDSLRIDDLGDIATNPFDLLDSIERVYQGLRLIAEAEVRPVILGGDHTLSLGVLRALAETQGPIGVLHVDAHTDINDRQFGVSITHGTWFRRACEEGLIDRSRSAQIGVRATGYSATDFDWSRSEGIQVIQAERCWHQSLTPLMGEIRERMKGGPVYLSFDIDAIDPAYAPATGTPEPGGLTSIQAIEIVRGLYGLDLIGADIVEVCPPYDHGGITALLAANLAFEVLCVLPGVEHTKS